MKRVILLFFGVVFAVFVCGLNENFPDGRNLYNANPADNCFNCLPKPHLRVYERRSCKPVMSIKCDCPLSYDCPQEVTTPPLPEAERRRLRRLCEYACIFDNKVYKLGENLKIPCAEQCFCELSKTARNVSGYMIRGDAYGDCRDVNAQRDCGHAPLPGCHHTYPEDRCSSCPNGQICPGDENADFRCKVGNETYNYGEKMYHLEKDPCMICHCDVWFDENNLEGSTCWRERCHLNLEEHLRGKNGNTIDQDVLMQYCTPVYQKKGCCPWDFICDKDFKPEAGIFESRPSNLTDTCVLRGNSYKIGEKVDFRLEDTYTKDRYFRGDGECTCRVPPLMTCYYSRS